MTFPWEGREQENSFNETLVPLNASCMAHQEKILSGETRIRYSCMWAAVFVEYLMWYQLMTLILPETKINSTILKLKYFGTILTYLIDQWKWKSFSCVWLCNPMYYTVHGILQARTLEWVAVPFPRGSSQPRDQTQASHNAGRFFTSWATREANHTGYTYMKVII